MHGRLHFIGCFRQCSVLPLKCILFLGKKVFVVLDRVGKGETLHEFCIAFTAPIVKIHPIFVLVAVAPEKKVIGNPKHFRFSQKQGGQRKFSNGEKLLKGQLPSF